MSTSAITGGRWSREQIVLILLYTSVAMRMGVGVGEAQHGDVAYVISSHGWAALSKR